MGAVLFRCPATGYRVTGWIADDPTEEDVYMAVECHACGRAHFVNRKTEKTLGDPDEP